MENTTELGNSCGNNLLFLNLNDRLAPMRTDSVLSIEVRMVVARFLVWQKSIRHYNSGMRHTVNDCDGFVHLLLIRSICIVNAVINQKTFNLLHKNLSFT